MAHRRVYPALLAAFGLVALALPACRNAPESAQPTAIVTVLAATPEPTATAVPVQPIDTPELEATQPAAQAEAPEEAEIDPDLPLGADLDLVAGVVAYNLGDATITQERFPEDSRFRYMPVRLEGLIAVPEGQDRPAPVVVILHGNHRGCPLDPDQHAVDPWPCTVEDEQANYKGFDYLVKSLADEGYIALSLNVNGEYTLGFGEGDFGERLEQIIRLHLAALEEASRGGTNEFGVELAGAADLGRLAFIGHSQGGEAASLLTRIQGWDSPYSMVDNGFGPVDGVLLVAPSQNFAESPGSNVPVAALLPACDGDVVQLSGQAFYEAVRQDPAFPYWAATVLLEHGNHNGFNRILRRDNSRGPGCETVLAAEDQQAFLVNYARDFLGAIWSAPPDQIESAARLGLDAAPASPEMVGLSARAVTLLPQRRSLLRAVDEAEVEAAVTTGRMRAAGVDVLFCPDGFFVTSENPIAEACRRPNTTQPGNPAQVIVSWTEPGAALRFTLGAEEQDISAFRSLRLRAAFDPMSPLNAGSLSQSFSVVIADLNGASATVVVPASDPALQRPPGEVADDQFLQQGTFDGIVHMSDIRLPIAAFDSVDLTRIESVDLVFDQTDSGSLFMADIELIRPEHVIGANSLLLDNADGAHNDLAGIGRLNSQTTCTAVLVDVGGGPEAPAYVLTNGHCVQPWDANAVFTNLPADTTNVTFNYFVDTGEQAVTVRAREAAYSTMKGRDLAILELDTTLGELAAQGIIPLSIAPSAPTMPAHVRVVGAPTTGVPAAIAYLREEYCQASGRTDLFEFIWHFDDMIRTGCQDIYGGSSGSPVFVEGEPGIVGLINTTTVGGVSPCAAGMPCEVGPGSMDSVGDASYATSVVDIGACFDNGHFDMGLTACPLDRGQQLAISNYPTQPIQPTSLGTEGQEVAASWNAVLSGNLPFYRYKTGPATSTDCRDENGYGDVLALSSQQVIDDVLPAGEGSYVLCVVAGQTPEMDDSWQQPAQATMVRAEIDTTPPRIEPRINILRLGDFVSAEPIFALSELADFRLKVGPPDTTDCNADVDYSRYRRVPVMVSTEELPVKVCVVGSDSAGNEGPPIEHIVASP